MGASETPSQPPQPHPTTTGRKLSIPSHDARITAWQTRTAT